MKLDPVVIDADGKIVRRGRQGTVIRPGSTKTVPMDVTPTGTIAKEKPRPLPTSGGGPVSGEGRPVPRAGPR
jgi:hypothetical protein